MWDLRFISGLSFALLMTFAAFHLAPKAFAVYNHLVLALSMGMSFACAFIFNMGSIEEERRLTLGFFLKTYLMALFVVTIAPIAFMHRVEGLEPWNMTKHNNLSTVLFGAGLFSVILIFLAAASIIKKLFGADLNKNKQLKIGLILLAGLFFGAVMTSGIESGILLDKETVMGDVMIRLLPLFSSLVAMSAAYIYPQVLQAAKRFVPKVD